MTQTTPALQHIAVDPAGARKLGMWNWPAANGNNAHAVVCVHGLTRQARDFDVLARDLSAERRVVSVDMAGRGQSDWLQDPMGYQIPTYAQDMAVVLATLKAQGVTQIDWVGTSMGGLIGLAICGHPLMQAQCGVRRLVLNDVGPTLSWPAVQRIQSYIATHMRHASVEAAAAAMWQLSTGFGPHTPQQWLELSQAMVKSHPEGGVVLHYDPALAVPFRQATQASTLEGDAALWGLYDAISARTLVLRGALSDLLTPETVQHMAVRGPKAACVEFAGVGHAPTLVAADQRLAIRQFLDAP